MPELRKTEPLETPGVFLCDRPFSNFKFNEKYFDSLESLSRILSQCRQSGCKTIVYEKIGSVGFAKDDDEELQSANVGFVESDLIRLSFFTRELRKDLSDLKDAPPDSFLGYAILKKNQFHDIRRWTVFESVVQPSRHDNNFVHVKREYEVTVKDRIFQTAGNLYCQQNSVTNVCAHVALRTALSAVLPEGDISYSEINSILARRGIHHMPGAALGRDQIKAVIEDKGFTVFHLKFEPTLTEGATGEAKKDVDGSIFPYNKYIYAGIESGWPVLLGFHFGNDVGHIVPVLGHTFNEDTWVPRADSSYFKIGKDTRYISSETWVSTYIGHDDNFGSNFCIPRNYLQDKTVNVFVIAPKECKYDAVKAEAIAIDYLYYSLAPNMQMPENNYWSKKLQAACGESWVVLRAVLLRKEDYIRHLREISGWEGEEISPDMIKALDALLHGQYWMVEISLPELFPANKRKLGEILLSLTIPPTASRNFESFILARLPEYFYFLDLSKGITPPKFSTYPSGVKDHVDIYHS